jgi:DNA-binding transcriptional LysR family regulator
LTSSSLVARRLASVALLTVASPEYLRAHGTPATPQDLRNHVCLLYTLSRTPGEWHFDDERKQSINVHVNGCLRCNNDDALKRAALDGIGIARFPDLFISEDIASGRLVRLLGAYEPPPSSLCAVFPTRANLPPKVRVFVDFLAQTLTQPVR